MTDEWQSLPPASPSAGKGSHEEQVPRAGCGASQGDPSRL